MPIFVVHHHLSKREHYDLRLELDSVLKSWAVPKEPPKAKGAKRLAIQVEDHPLSYAKFSGKIPEGSYGAGLVKIWDKGSFKLIDKKPHKLVFELSGKKMKGTYVLLNFKTQANKKNWLLFKKS